LDLIERQIRQLLRRNGPGVRLSLAVETNRVFEYACNGSVEHPQVLGSEEIRVQPVDPSDPGFA